MGIDITIKDKRIGMTHNVSPMWREAGCYDILYNPPVGTKGKNLLPILEKAIDDMNAYPEKYMALNPVNGWGSYDSALEFLQNLHRIARQHPRAKVRSDP